MSTLRRCSIFPPFRRSPGSIDITPFDGVTVIVSVVHDLDVHRTETRQPGHTSFYALTRTGARWSVLMPRRDGAVQVVRDLV